MSLMALVLTCASLLPPPAASGPWQWPLRPAPAVVRGFHPPATPWGPGHRGVDLRADPGQPVRTAAAGRVTFAGRIAGHGVVAVTHGRLRTTYLPVVPSVRAGRHLRAGAVIGTLQDLPGHCGPVHCLHWGLRDDLRYLDPLSLLRFRVRLLPYWSSSSRPPHHRWAGSVGSPGSGSPPVSCVRPGGGATGAWPVSGAGHPTRASPMTVFHRTAFGYRWAFVPVTVGCGGEAR